MIFSFKEKTPALDPTVFVAPGAFVIGDVHMGKNSSVWFNTVIRGDEESIKIGNETNIQDNCTVHSDEGVPVEIGDRVTVGHNAVLHGCRVGSGTVIGMHCTLLNGCEVGEDSMVGAGALVTPGTKIPPRSLALGAPAKVLRELSPEEIKEAQSFHRVYLERAAEYRRHGFHAGGS